MIITKKNLYIDGKCRFCKVQEHEKHVSCYHGFRDMMGIKSLDLEYMTDKEAEKYYEDFLNCKTCKVRMIITQVSEDEYEASCPDCGRIIN